MFKNKLIQLTALIFMYLVTTAVAGYLIHQQIKKNNENIDSMLELKILPVIELSNLRNDLQNSQKSFMKMFYYENKNDMHLIKKTQKEIKKKWGKYYGTGMKRNTEFILSTKVDRLMHNYNDKLNELILLIEKRNFQTAHKQFIVDLDPIYQQLDLGLRDINAFNLSEALRSSKKLKRDSRSLIYNFSIYGLVATLAVVFIYYWIACYILTPVDKLVEIAVKYSPRKIIDIHHLVDMEIRFKHMLGIIHRLK